jgi:hypothetical protein
VNDIYGLKNATRDGGPPGPPDWLAAGFLAAPWLLALGLALLLRARRRALADPAGRRARGAAAEFHRRIGAAGADPAALLAAYLAARLRRPPAAVIAPDLEILLAAEGIPPEPAARAAALVRELTAARYGGRAAAAGPAAATALVEELEGHFRAREEGA